MMFCASALVKPYAGLHIEVVVL